MAAEPQPAPAGGAREGRLRRASSGWAGRLALSAAAFALTLGVLEIGLRLSGQPSAAGSPEPSFFWRGDELLGWSNQPGASGIFVGPHGYPVEYRTQVEINSQGLRGPELAPLPAGGLRVLVLGDSLVAAFEVTYAETFVALTEQRLARSLGRPVQMLNAGVRGYGTDQNLLYFRERGRHLEPHLVVYMQSRNDFEDNITLHRMRRPFGKPAFQLREDGSLAPTGYPVPAYPLCSAWGLDTSFTPRRLDGVAGRALCFAQLHFADHSALFTFGVQKLIRSPRLLSLLRQIAAPGTLAAREAPRPRQAGFLPLQVAAASDAGSRQRASYALTSALVLQLAAEVRATGAGFVWVAERSQVAQLDRDTFLPAGIEPVLLEPAGSPDAPIYFRNDAHLNWRGHLLASLLLAPVLERELRALAPW